MTEKTQATDRLFRRPADRPFLFDDNVARVFADMALRSIPGYGLSLQLISLLAARYLVGDAIAVDLGCANGASTKAIAHARRQPDTPVLAIDASEAMLRHARESLRQLHAVQFIQARIENFPTPPCKLALLHFALQFVEEEHRLLVLRHLREALLPEGVLVLFEKLQVPPTSELAQLYDGFKRANGYTRAEIINKRKALQGVLRPRTEEDLRGELLEAGFSDIQPVFRAIQFAGWVAHP